MRAGTPVGRSLTPLRIVASMLDYLRDTFAAVRLKARYRRLIHEQLVQFTEGAKPAPVSEDPGRWRLVGDLPAALVEPQRTDARRRARQLVTQNPHARNVLRLLEAYVAGPGLSLSHQVRGPEETGGDDSAHRLAARADRLWRRFLEVNERHYCPREHARRTWRDGESFVRKFSRGSWPPDVRFVDPEQVGPTSEHPESLGILTEPGDVESPRAYLLVEPSGELLESVPAPEMLHTRTGVDSNQKRGTTIFTSILDVLDRFEKWVETELLARKLQSSIVLWRKVQGSPQQAVAAANGAAAGGDGMRRERLLPGTILTTNHATEIQFLQPNTNFGDAVPLGRMLLLAAAAGAGLPEFMLTSDASNGNFASTMVAEGPAVKLFQSEQQFFAAEFSRLWRWILSDAVSEGLLPSDFFERVEPQWSFPQLVNRDRPRERMADSRLVDQRVLSRAEVARRDGADPAVMRAEIAGEG